MASSAFWKNLGDKFKEIRDPNESLLVEWVEPAMTTHRETWYIRGEDSLHGSLVQFTDLATIAGRAIAGPEADFKDWLMLLKDKYAVYDRHVVKITDQDGTEQVLIRGTLHQIIRKSIDRCGISELEEHEREWVVSQPSTLSKHTHADIAQTQPPKPQTVESRKESRRRYIEPLLLEKGWSPFEWATESEVAHATVMDYLDGKTSPFNSTRAKLANGLNIPAELLPK
jgi:hypothetical protein